MGRDDGDASESRWVLTDVEEGRGRPSTSRSSSCAMARGGKLLGALALAGLMGVGSLAAARGTFRTREGREEAIANDEFEFAGVRDVSSLGGAASGEWFDPKVRETLRAYGQESADVHTMRWTHSDGFTFNSHDHAPDLAVKMRTATELMAKTIHTYYPERLKPNQPPFEIIYVVTDFPQTPCVRREGRAAERCGNVKEWAPIYTFSSVPRNTSLLPTLVGATLITLAEKVEAAMGKPTVEPSRGMWSNYALFDLAAFDVDKRRAYEWDNLVNKTIWRGTDYPFLGPAYENSKESMCHSILGRSWHSEKCQLRDMTAHDDPREAFRSMLSSTEITPRTRAVLMSKLDDDSWLNARFVNPEFLRHGGAARGGVAAHGARNQDHDRFVLGAKFGVDAETPTSGEELARFKYQLDLGGWGGTSWTGTLHKLSMPGVLFHHETSMKDSYFDDLIPWRHYIPIKEDLSDLRAKYQWARAHDDVCRQISLEAKRWLARFVSDRGLLRHNYVKLAVPLERVLDPTSVGAYLLPFRVAHERFSDTNGDNL